MYAQAKLNPNLGTSWVLELLVVYHLKSVFKFIVFYVHKNGSRRKPEHWNQSRFDFHIAYYWNKYHIQRSLKIVISHSKPCLSTFYEYTYDWPRAIHSNRVSSKVK